jgi:hypothetical protein
VSQVGRKICRNHLKSFISWKGTGLTGCPFWRFARTYSARKAGFASEERPSSLVNVAVSPKARLDAKNSPMPQSRGICVNPPSAEASKGSRWVRRSFFQPGLAQFGVDGGGTTGVSTGARRPDETPDKRQTGTRRN